MKNIFICLAILAAAVLCGCRGEKARAKARELTGGDPGRGMQAIENNGCAACHTISGIPGADALVGPSLSDLHGRNYIGGVLENTPANLVKWLKNPPAQSPRTAMPNLHLTDEQARDIASYLYTLK
jgi:cytochrome c2